VVVYLVRHAETACNAARIVQPVDAPLSVRGDEQAARLAARLATVGIVRMRTSDLLRARRTAEIVAAAVGVDAILDPDLRERDYGAVRGRPYAELTEDIFGPDYVPPEGEGWAVFHARVDRAWARVVADAKAGRSPLAVVTHGLVYWSILTRHVAGADTARMHVGNTAVAILEGPDPWRARLLDCTAHLDVLAAHGGAPA